MEALNLEIKNLQRKLKESDDHKNDLEDDLHDLQEEANDKILKQAFPTEFTLKTLKIRKLQ